MRKKTLICGALVTVLLFSGSILSIASEEPKPSAEKSERSSKEIFLYTGSPLILSNGEIKMLDSANPDISATVIGGKTLLPVRAISEYFGGEVTYDKTKHRVTIQYGGTHYIFPIDQKKYIVEDSKGSKEYVTNSNSTLIDGRTMVPLRVILENVLGKKVSYYNRVIAVADQSIDLKNQPALLRDVESKIGEAVKAGTMRQLELALSGEENIRYGAVDMAKNAAIPQNNGMNEQAEADSAAPASGADYSTTNAQVEGIDEADVVKTDGKYIYIGGNNVVRIIGANRGSLSDGTAIKLSTDKLVNEIYVSDGKLAILGSRREHDYVTYDTSRTDINIEIKSESRVVDIEAEDSAVDERALVERSIGIMPPYYRGRNFSFIDVYDISDPLKPVYIKGHEMEGSYQSSRKNEDIIYMVTNMYPYGDIVLPVMRDTVTGNKETRLTLDDVMIMPKHPSTGYLIISAVNVDNHEKTEVEAITAYGMNLYMNDSALYLSSDGANDVSSIIKFKLEGMKVGYAGSGEVKGHLLNQFSMDEHAGNLRVATTTWNEENALYVLDHSMNLMGSVTGLAKRETIYSVRFIGDKGYIVTFRTMDPLFVLDLSDPENPKVTGELKIPGFSNYLHPVGEDLILGIGADTYDIYKKDSSGKDIIIGTRQGGIKYSLFDVSDMGKPKEVSKYVVGDAGSSSEAYYNHKAIMVDPSSERVAMDANLYYEDQKGNYQQGAVVMSYEGKKLTLKGILDSEPSGVYGNDIPYGRRLLYIGDMLYYVQDGRITSYDYDSLKKIDDLVLR